MQLFLLNLQHFESRKNKTEYCQLGFTAITQSQPLAEDENCLCHNSSRLIQWLLNRFHITGDSSQVLTSEGYSLHRYKTQRIGDIEHRLMSTSITRWGKVCTTIYACGLYSKKCKRLLGGSSCWLCRNMRLHTSSAIVHAPLEHSFSDESIIIKRVSEWVLHSFSNLAFSNFVLNCEHHSLRLGKCMAKPKRSCWGFGCLLP